jgi:hypothetical protein
MAGEVLTDGVVSVSRDGPRAADDAGSYALPPAYRGALCLTLRRLLLLLLPTRLCGAPATSCAG